MYENLLKDAEFQRVATAQASGTSTVNSDEVDMEGFDAVLFQVALGTTGVGVVKLQQDSVTGMGSAADLEGTSQAYDGDDDDLIVLTDLIRPRERFVRCVVTRPTAAEIDAIIAIKYRARKRPVTQGATVVGAAGELHLSPAEGTA